MVLVTNECTLVHLNILSVHCQIVLPCLWFPNWCLCLWVLFSADRLSLTMIVFFGVFVCSGGHELSKSTGNAGGRIACGMFTGSLAKLRTTGCSLSCYLEFFFRQTAPSTHCTMLLFPGIIGLQGWSWKCSLNSSAESVASCVCHHHIGLNIPGHVK